MTRFSSVSPRAIRCCSSVILFVSSMLLVESIAVADDWPQWGGPQRDCVWHEEGIVEKLPTDGLLPRVWSAEVAEGYSGPAVANGRVFLTDRIADGEFERLLCFDAETGKPLWKHQYYVRYTISYAFGPRATPVIDEERVYFVGAGPSILYECGRRCDTLAEAF